MCWPLFSGAPGMSCGMKLLDLRRKRILCWKFFAMILYLKLVAYTGKIFREDGLSDVAFVRFGFGKGWVCVWFSDGPTEQGLPGGSLLAPRGSRIHLDFLQQSPPAVCLCFWSPLSGAFFLHTVEDWRSWAPALAQPLKGPWLNRGAEMLSRCPVSLFGACCSCLWPLIGFLSHRN